MSNNTKIRVIFVFLFFKKKKLTFMVLSRPTSPPNGSLAAD